MDESTLVVAPFHVTILNPSDLKDDLGPGVPNRVYQSFARPRIAENLKTYSHFGNVVVAAYRGRPRMQSRRLGGVKSLGLMHWTGEAGSDTVIVMKLPQDGEILQFGTTRADFVLFLSSFSVNSYETFYYVPNYTPPGVPGGGGGGYYSSRKLVQQSHFAIWDNTQGRLVAYGSARSEAGVFGAMTDNTWKKGLRELMKNIVRETPFYKAPSRFSSSHR